MDAYTLPRPKTVVFNPYRAELQLKYLDHDLPYWLDDVMTGASRSQDSTRISPMLLLTLLSVYDAITTTEIKTFLNRKREALEGRTVTDESYFRDIRRACAYAISAIEYQLDHGRQWSDHTYVRGSLETMVSQFKAA